MGEAAGYVRRLVGRLKVEEGEGGVGMLFENCHVGNLYKFSTFLLSIRAGVFLVLSRYVFILKVARCSNRWTDKQCSL